MHLSVDWEVWLIMFHAFPIVSYRTETVSWLLMPVMCFIRKKIKNCVHDKCINYIGMWIMCQHSWKKKMLQIITHLLPAKQAMS